MFIDIEGLDGSGKGTAIASVIERLKKDGYTVIDTREPGGTPISEKIREILLDKNNKEMDPVAEAFLYAASRRQHVAEKIYPYIEEPNTIIITDRFLLSSLVYQGIARGLGVDNVFSLNEPAITIDANHFIIPDLTIYLDVDAQTAKQRIDARGDADRFDLEAQSFHEKVRQGYNDIIDDLNDLSPKRTGATVLVSHALVNRNLYGNTWFECVKIDATKPPEKVADELYNEIKRNIKR